MNSLRIHLSAALLGVLVVALLLFSFRTVDRAEAVLQPEIERKAAAVAESSAALVGKALALGIPLDRLQGLGEHLQRIVADNPDIAFITLRNSAGASLYGSPAPQAGADDAATVEAPVAGAPGGLSVVVWLDPDFAAEVVSTLWIDLVIVMFVTAMVALELVYVGFGAGLYAAIEGVENRLRSMRRGDLRLHLPIDAGGEFGRLARSLDGRLDRLHAAYASLRQRVVERGDKAAQQALEMLHARFGLGERVIEAPGRVIAVRAPLFVFMLAEELTRPFLPGYIKALAQPVPGLSPEFVASLPMVTFLVVVAASQPLLGGTTERLGRRRALVLGALLGVAGYVASAFAGGLLGLSLARAVSGLGFAMVFVAAQGFVIDSTNQRQRSSGMAMFISAILVAGLCGPPIGGILADRIGVPGAFVVAGGFAAVSLVLACLCMPAAEPQRPRGPAIRWSDFGRIVASPSMAALLFLCAMPAKIILVAFCFFLVPLEMQALGASQSTTGRMLMIYPIAMVLLVPTFAALADRWDMRASFVAGGGVLAGSSAFVLATASTDIPVIGVMLLGLGLGQAISIAALSGLVGDLGRQLPAGVSETSVYGIFRLVERTGNALGPLIAGGLLGVYGFSTTVMLIGGATALCALTFALTTILARPANLELPSAGS
ncbi:MFS transporter [Jiella pelagia]|uniref:MFS transporter n=1 Tax=Jiella pelagia TaxID=2986949 RepID=A0ABY7BW88_9HYPH|nr:MFS transporter [Jiella pelagia]WAP67628.1 MFS transporter [Jiella pelagia]